MWTGWARGAIAATENPAALQATESDHVVEYLAIVARLAGGTDEPRVAAGARDVEMLVLAQLIGAVGTLVARRRGITALGDRTPMVSVTHADPERIAEAKLKHVHCR